MSDPDALLVEAYLDGSLDVTGARTLAARLHAGGDEARSIRDHLAFAGLLGQALDEADAHAVASSVQERIDAQGTATAFIAAMDRTLDARSATRRRRHAVRHAWPWSALIAATLTLSAMGIVWWAARERFDPPTIACRIVACTERTRVERGDASAVTTIGTPLYAGDVVTDGPATLRHDDGTTISLEAGSRLRVERDMPGKRLVLSQGRLEATVTAQPEGRPFHISTPVARVEVVGTRFQLSAGDAGSRLDLHQGTVRFIRLLDQRVLSMQAGETASVADGEAFTARPITGANQNTSKAWRRLFPITGLTGWIQQHGRWTQDGDTVRGTSPPNGTARLLSGRPFRDLDLTCRLRIREADHAEIQVGDYNWFFTVPAGSGDWVEVHLTQRGATLTCTAAGLSLAAEAGDGAAQRPGPLSFYIRGGTLEIRDALIHTTP